MGSHLNNRHLRFKVRFLPQTTAWPLAAVIAKAAVVFMMDSAIGNGIYCGRFV
jgi:mannitol-specific phosphotransferase system IIBC component